MKHIIWWLLTLEILILLIIAVGGITRLEESGLSMVEWKPLMGIIPPLNETTWEETFNLYKKYPEYQQLHPDMKLGEFKKIFFWEYLHRILGRVLGLLFLLPYLLFILCKKINKKLTQRLFIVLLLIIAQGLLGWYMVKSGLADKPQVSHYRLAAHLLLALLLFSYIFWLILELLPNEGVFFQPQMLSPGLTWSLLGIIILQIMYGAFVAGLNAGFIYNTFPGMQGYFFPPGGLSQSPRIMNFFNNPISVQWTHRLIAWILLFIVLFIWIRTRPKRFSLHLLASITVLQFTFGVCTLIWHVPTSMAVAHQITGCILLTLMVFLCHNCVKT